MTAVDLKNILIHKIAEIDDSSFLKAIKTMLDAKTNSEVLPLQRNNATTSSHLKRSLGTDYTLKAPTLIMK